ncbi:MAG: helix-hairpin-helix domain-containing protein [Mariprofundales bacterium]|nr:helix-hairpin-helix domain-containing protein [Mariprofundales bacterium]
MAPLLTEITGVGEATAAVLADHGFISVQSLAEATIEQLTQVPSFGAARAQATIQAAMKVANLPSNPMPANAKPAKKASKKKKRSEKKNKAEKKQSTKDKSKKKSKSKKKK